MKSSKLPDGTVLPTLGQGTWRIGNRPPDEEDEISALQAGIELGMTVIDTAEMYAEGGLGAGCRQGREETMLARRISRWVSISFLPSRAGR